MGISVDSREDSVELHERLELPFPLLSDPERTTIEAYGLADQSRPIALPATVIVAQGGETIHWSYVGERPSDRPELDQIIGELERGRPD